MWNSGKLLILGIVAAAVLLAGASWWFRYNATHRMAEFWGPDVARRIRDAKRVHLSRMNRDAEGGMLTDYMRDVSSAPGLTHLRAALLEDKNFEWPAEEVSNSTPTDNSIPYGWELSFVGDSKPIAHIYFADDLKQAFNFLPGRKCRRVSCAPISRGLNEMFTEMISTPVN